MVGKLLDIFRVFYNYAEPGADKQTPAMRLGLSKKVVTVGEILGVNEKKPLRLES